MKNIIKRSSPQRPGLCAISFVAAVVFSLAGCEDGPDSGGYFEFDGAGTITGYDDDGPKNVTLPSTIDGVKVTAVGKNAFRGKQLTEVNILTGVTTIGEGAFSENELTSLTMLDCVVNIRASAFKENRLKTAAIPNSVIIIGEGAFANNWLTSVTIGSGVTSIGEGAFSGNKLDGIAIPNSVTGIGKDAFSGNPLTSVTIGASKDYASNIVPNFGTAYNGNGKQAGTYLFDNDTWTKQQ